MISSSYIFSYSNRFLCCTLDLLSSHLLLAVKDESCPRSVLGEEGKLIMKLLLKLVDEPNLSHLIVSKIKSTLHIGAHFLLPKPEARLDLLLSLLPQSAEDLKKSTIGQVRDWLQILGEISHLISWKLCHQKHDWLTYKNVIIWCFVRI